MTTTQRAAALGLAAVAIQAVMLLAFAWPASNSEPRDLPLVVAGPQAAAVAQRLEQQAPGVFTISTAANADAARAAVTGREAYGAIVTGAGAPAAMERSGRASVQGVLVASGASPAVSQQLTQLAQQLAGVHAAPVQDVVAIDADDPRGAGFAAMVLPLVMASLSAGVLLSLLIPSVLSRAVGLGVFAVGGGLVSMAIAQDVLSVLPGSYLALSGVAGLACFAVAGTVVGLASLIGPAGIGLGAVTMLLIGNPLSAAASAPELLPQPWGAVGQLLPPGATVSLLRAVAYFDGTRAGGPLAVTLVWAGLAIALIGAATLKARRRNPELVEVAALG